MNMASVHENLPLGTKRRDVRVALGRLRLTYEHQSLDDFVRQSTAMPSWTADSWSGMDRNT